MVLRWNELTDIHCLALDAAKHDRDLDVQCKLNSEMTG